MSERETMDSIKRCPLPDNGTCLNEDLIEDLRERNAELEAERERWTAVVYNERHAQTRRALMQDQYCAERTLRIAAEKRVDELRARIAELETKLRTLEQFYSHTFAGTGVARCAHCGSEGDSAEPPEHASTCPYYGLPVIDLEAES